MKKLIKKLLRSIAYCGYWLMARVLPVSKDIIVFESNVGRNYSGNVRAIYEEMVAQGLDQKYKMVWSLENVNEPIPGNVIPIRRARMKYLYYMAVAKVWVSDSRMPYWLRKRKKNTYIQTWHGTPLKKLALDMDVLSMGGETDVDKYREKFAANTRTWDYLISQNGFSTGTFRRCFAFEKEMLEIGYPRNDVLFHKNNEADIKVIKEKLHLPLDKKIILYAPTWRDDQFHQRSIYKFATEMDFDKMKEALSDEYVMIVKFHYLVKDNIDWTKYGDFIYECNETQDIAELYLVSDMMITDYSSVMFDYSLLRRPMFFFAYDLENYKENLRGFYFDFLGTAPGPVVETTDDLTSAILNYNEAEWKVRYDAFTKLYNHADDGEASKRVVEVILNALGN